MENKGSMRVVLLPSSYVHLSLSSTPPSRFTPSENLYYPDAELLLESFVKTRIRELDECKWTSELDMWAISYLYGMLMLADNALDSSSDEQAKMWFNQKSRRYEGRLDRTTVTMRVGRRPMNTS